MSPIDTKPGKLWGQQYPFERNSLQRTMTMTGLGGVFAAAVVILVHADTAAVLGISLICAGLALALAAVSRRRYVRESRLGFAILRTRGGGFVPGSALAFAVVGLLVAAVVVLE